MTLDLSVIRGPIAEEDLDAITETYGAGVDPRYGSREFCRILFNENPIGYSYHAFVRDGRRVVGHYAIIPMRTRSRGSTVLTGKGEALFLAESHRKSTIAATGGDVLAGLAMMNALHERVLSEGLVAIHSVTTPAVGIILRMQGFRALKLSLDQVHFLINPPELKESSRSRAYLARFICYGQHVLLGAARTALRLSAAPAVESNPPAHAREHLTAIAASDAPDRPTWAVSRDLENLEWMKRLGRLEIVSIAGRPEHFAAVLKGQRHELLLWNVPADAKRNGLAILCTLLAQGVRQSAGMLSLTRRLAAQGGPSLRFALRALGFFPTRIPITLLVNSPDDYYRQADNVDYSRLFNV